MGAMLGGAAAEKCLDKPASREAAVLEENDVEALVRGLNGKARMGVKD